MYFNHISLVIWNDLCKDFEQILFKIFVKFWPQCSQAGGSSQLLSYWSWFIER